MICLPLYFKLHSTSLKVQTSKDNHLSSLSIWTEKEVFQYEASWERNKDDLIFQAAILQDEYWVDHSAILKNDGVIKVAATAIKAALLSLDHNLQLKVQSKLLFVTSKHDLTSILSTGT